SPTTRTENTPATLASLPPRSASKAFGPDSSQNLDDACETSEWVEEAHAVLKRSAMGAGLPSSRTYGPGQRGGSLRWSPVRRSPRGAAPARLQGLARIAAAGGHGASSRRWPGPPRPPGGQARPVLRPPARAGLLERSPPARPRARRARTRRARCF